MGTPADGTCSDTKGANTTGCAAPAWGRLLTSKREQEAVLAARNAGIPVVEKRARTSLAELASEFLEVFGMWARGNTRRERPASAGGNTGKIPEASRSSSRKSQILRFLMSEARQVLSLQS